MKKYLRFIVKIVICFFIVLFYTTVSQAESTTSTIYYSLSNNGTLRISGNGIVADKEEMAKFQESTKKLIIKEGITDLLDVDLWKFVNLETIQLPKSINVIHEKLFTRCVSLKEVDIPGIRYIGAEAFSDCKSLKKLTNAEAVESIEREAFWNCNSLEWPSFGNSLNKIGEVAFLNCFSFKQIVIPDSVTEIRRRAFCHCDNLEKLVLPASLKIWNQSATKCCPKLHTIVNRSNLSCQIYDFDGYRIWKTNKKRIKKVPAKKTAVATGKKIKIIYKLDGGKKTGKLPKYYEYGTILRIPQNIKKNGYIMAGWDCWDLKAKDADGTYESVDWRSYLGPVVREPEMHPIWLKYSAGNTKKGTVELKVGDPEYVNDDGGYYHYIVRYSDYKNMKNAKSRYISGYPAKAIFRRLKKGKIYYFQVGPLYDSENHKPDFWLKKHRIMLMYGKEASNQKQEIDRQHHTIPNQRKQRPKDKHRGNVYNLLFRHKIASYAHYAQCRLLRNPPSFISLFQNDKI